MLYRIHFPHIHLLLLLLLFLAAAFTYFAAPFTAVERKVRWKEQSLETADQGQWLLLEGPYLPTFSVLSVAAISHPVLTNRGKLVSYMKTSGGRKSCSNSPYKVNPPVLGICHVCKYL